MTSAVPPPLNTEVRSVVQALLDGESSARAHDQTRYRSWCACCVPQATPSPGKPQRRSPQRPQLAWRTRRGAQPGLQEAETHVL
jgi:hypothetical protein